jgi:hypothetical protein
LPCAGLKRTDRIYGCCFLSSNVHEIIAVEQTFGVTETPYPHHFAILVGKRSQYVQPEPLRASKMNHDHNRIDLRRHLVGSFGGFGGVDGQIDCEANAISDPTNFCLRMPRGKWLRLFQHTVKAKGTQNDLSLNHTTRSESIFARAPGSAEISRPTAMESAAEQALIFTRAVRLRYGTRGTHRI